MKFVICIHNGEYAGTLELRKVYEVMDDESAAKRNYIRVIDESGEDYLYPRSWFVFVAVPEDVEGLLHGLAVK
jgi:primosomal protein N'